MKTIAKETKKLTKPNGKKTLRDADYETADQIRSLENGKVSPETMKAYKILMRALADEPKN
jgi:hypothetical protein